VIGRPADFRSRSVAPVAAGQQDKLCAGGAHPG
jgi:hypothetical protein